MATPGGVIVHVDNRDIFTYNSVAATAYTEGGWVMWSADNTVTPCTAENDIPVGVLLTSWTTTENATQRPVQVIRRGIVRVRCNAAVTRSVYLHIGATNFRAEGTTTAADPVFGMCETAQATAGSLFLAAIDCYAIRPYAIT